MTLPNKITLLRMLMIPIIIIFIYIPLESITILKYTMDLNKLIIAVIFTVAAVTDFLDGYLARKNNQISTFGKFLDPIADKVLVISAMIYLVDISRISTWTVVVVIFREFIVTGIRLLAVEKGKVIAASPYGKIKTALTMIALIFMLFTNINQDITGLVSIIINVVWYLAVFFTILSGLDYTLKNKKIIFESF